MNHLSTQSSKPPQMRFRRTVAKAVWLAGACLASAFFAHPSMAQVYPTRPIRLIVPYTPGGLPDVVARLVSQHLGDALGQPVLVENKPGALGKVAMAALSTLPADGHTFLVTDSSLLTIAPLLGPAGSNDVRQELAPVVMVGSAPLYMAVNRNVPATSLEEFVAHVRQRPNGSSYGSSGTGTVHHLTAEAMRHALRIPLTHVPYKGSGPSVAALLAGDVDMVFTAYPNIVGFVKSGQARLIAVSSARRSTITPAVPALGEKLHGFDFSVMVAFFARSGTSPDIVARIATEVARIASRPDVQEQLLRLGMTPTGTGPSELAKILANEAVTMAQAFKAAQIQPE